MLELPVGVARVALPMAGSPLRAINSYVLKGDDGYILVDCGWDTPDVLDALQAGLRDLGIGLDDVRSLVVTHMHADHYGMAGTLLRLGRMRLLMHRLDWLYIDTNLRDQHLYRQTRDAWLARNGFAAPASDATKRLLEPLHRMTVVAPDTQLEDGDRVPIAGSACTVIWTPGHTLGHVCLHAPDARYLISGDHVLDPITPNVSINLEETVNPLGAYVASLRKIGAVDADLVLPAHGDPFYGLKRRVDELLRHHDEREAAVLDVLDGRTLAAGDVARALPWTRRRHRLDELHDTQQRLAVTETLSHLELLRAQGRVARTTVGDTLVYTQSAPAPGATTR